MSKNYRLTVFLVLLAVAAVSLVGCLKPGGNDSSSAPPSILAPDTTNTGLSSQGPDVIFKTANVLFSHDKHVTQFKRNCVDCHKVSALSTTIPWDMKHTMDTVSAGSDQVYTMAQIQDGKGCGICHKATGPAFNTTDKSNCARCHSNDAHSVVNAGELGSDSCKLCHSSIVSEYQTIGPKNTAHAKPFDAIRASAVSNLNSDSPDICLECHFHESVAGKSVAFGLSTALSHTITCQTCHYPTTANGGDKFDYRLRKDQKDLCVTCHHSRWVYGDQPGAVRPGAVEASTVGFPTLRPYTTTATSSFPIAWYSLFYGGNAASITAAVNGTAVSTNLGTFVPAYARGGKRPHESGDYDVLYAKVVSTPSNTAPTSIPMFTKDLDGKTLTYGETNHRQFEHACVECHMYRDKTNFVKTNYGHTFQATTSSLKDAGCVACHTKMGVAAVDVAARKAEIQVLINELGKRLNPDGSKDAIGDPAPQYIVNANDATADQNYIITNGLFTPATSSATSVIFYGAFWGWYIMQNDYAQGMHNYKFCKNWLENTIKVIDQCEAKGMLTKKWW